MYYEKMEKWLVETKQVEKKLRITLDKRIIREGDFVPIMDELRELGGSAKRGIQD